MAMKRALFSLYTLERVEEFARDLCDMGWEIIASKETFEVLVKNGLPVTDIKKFTGIAEDYSFPPTLHPKIEAYLTSDCDQRIDLVYVIPYPLSAGNDVGGRTLLSLAAKGKRIPVMTVKDMDLVIRELKNEGNISDSVYRDLVNKANALVASHYDDLLVKRDLYDLIFGKFEYELKNGENPYQVPAGLFSLKNGDALSICNFKRLSADAPCFTNLADSDSILYTMCVSTVAFKMRYSKVPYICITAKHGNPCGMGISWKEPLLAVDKALFGNPRAVWGGEVVTNFEITEAIAMALFKSKKREELFGDALWMLDLILAPIFAKEAVNLLGRRNNRKLLENKALLTPDISLSEYVYRFVRGGFLRQPPNNFVLDFSKVNLIGEKMEENTIDTLVIAWAVAWSSNHGGNEVAIAKESQLLSAGGGPSTVDAALTAVSRGRDYGHDLSGAVFAANAFFPFTDAPEILVEAGLKTGLVPRGGKQKSAVEDFFLKKGLNMVYLDERYRGFCRH